MAGPRAAAEALLLPAPIVAATVYPDGALVTRRVAIEAEPGPQTIRVRGLTPGLDVASVRVEAAQDHVEIASVDIERAIGVVANQAEARELLSRIEALEQQRAALSDRVRAADRQLELVGALIHGTPAVAADAEAGPPPAEHWREMLALVGEASAAAYGQQREAGQAIARLDEELERARQELAQLEGGRTDSYTATIALAATGTGAAELELTYQVAGASWRPLYDARLDTAAGRLELVQLAEVTQTTGEDWPDVQLSLATARVSAGTLPELETWFVDLQPEVPAGQELRDSQDALAPLGRGDEAAEAPAAAPAPAPVVLAAGEFFATYLVPGRVTVPANGTAKSVRLDVHERELELRAKAMPGVAPVAHLVGELVHEGEAPLLPGPMAIYRDGAFVGRQYLPLLRPGESRELSFGPDDRIAVDHRLASGEHGSSGIIRTEASETRVYRTEVTNHHDRPIEITVLNRLPVPLHELVEVELVRETTPVTERDVEDHEGVLAWRDTYAPGETRVITFGYTVRFPEDRRLANF